MVRFQVLASARCNGPGRRRLWRFGSAAAMVERWVPGWRVRLKGVVGSPVFAGRCL